MTRGADSSALGGGHAATRQRSWHQVTWDLLVWLALVFVLSGFASGLSASPLAIYSFTNAVTVPPQKDNFIHDFKLPALFASTLRMHGIDTTGVVTDFHGTNDNTGYGSVFDGRGFETHLNALTSTVQSSTNYAEFILTPSPGRALTITNVRVDFGFDTGLPNDADTGAKHALYLSQDGSNFSMVGGIYSNLSGEVYPGFTIMNDLSRAVTNFSGITNPITFRLAFAHNGAGAGFLSKFAFIDDIVVEGFISPVFTLTMEDEIAYEENPDHIALFNISRTRTNDAVSVQFEMAEANLTNGAATLGVDYTSTKTSPLVFAPGVATRKIAIRPINNDHVEGPGRITWAEPPETITLTILPSSDYVFPGNTNAVAVLYDDDMPGARVCFRDDFNTEASSNNWSVVSAQRFGAPEPPFVGFAYDYSVDGIPPAPGNTDTLGLKLSVNATAGSAAAVNLFHLVSGCSTNKFVLSFDAYLQYSDVAGFAEHALAGINASATSTNLIYRSGGFIIEGDGQFVTLVGNKATNTSIARAHLWSPADSTNELDSLPPGPIASQLLNNPPYGVNGGDSGVLGCDVNSTNKTWLQCQFVQLDDMIQFRVNGYPVMKATLTNGNQLALIQANRIGAASLGAGVIMLGYLDMYDSTSTPDHFVVFDNVELRDLDGIALTGMAVDGLNMVLNFYSDISTDYDPGVFSVLTNSALEGPFADGFAGVEAINEDIAGSEGYFGAILYGGFSSGDTRFFQVSGTTNSPLETP